MITRARQHSPAFFCPYDSSVFELEGLEYFYLFRRICMRVTRAHNSNIAIRLKMGKCFKCTKSAVTRDLRVWVARGWLGKFHNFRAQGTS